MGWPDGGKVTQSTPSLLYRWGNSSQIGDMIGWSQAPLSWAHTKLPGLKLGGLSLGASSLV